MADDPWHDTPTHLEDMECPGGQHGVFINGRCRRCGAAADGYWHKGDLQMEEKLRAEVRRLRGSDREHDRAAVWRVLGTDPEQAERDNCGLAPSVAAHVAHLKTVKAAAIAYRDAVLRWRAVEDTARSSTGERVEAGFDKRQAGEALFALLGPSVDQKCATRDCGHPADLGGTLCVGCGLVALVAKLCARCGRRKGDHVLEGSTCTFTEPNPCRKCRQDPCVCGHHEP